MVLEEKTEKHLKNGIDSWSDCKMGEKGQKGRLKERVSEWTRHWFLTSSIASVHQIIQKVYREHKVQPTELPFTSLSCLSLTLSQTHSVSVPFPLSRPILFGIL